MESLFPEFKNKSSVKLLGAIIVGLFAVSLIIGLVVTVSNFEQFAAVLSGPPPASGKQFTTLGPGSTLPSDADCAARVRRTTWEPRPNNSSKNQYRAVKGTDFNLPAYDGTNNGIWLGDHPQKANVLLNRLSGNFTGTTDEILQWAACKWGLDEDMARAQAVVESTWDMNVIGDNGESFGILQVRTTSHAGAFPGAQKSTAFNADYTYYRWRLCFEGLVDYLAQGTNYAAGDAWGCMGTWYTGNWYGSGGGGSASGAQQYIDTVKQRLSERTWESWSGSQVTAVPTSPQNNPTSTRTPTNKPPTVTSVVTAQPTISTGTRLSLTVLLHGIGKGGDNVNAQAVGTVNPLHPSRIATIEILGSNNQIVKTKQSGIEYQSGSGNFTGTVDVTGLATGYYTVRIQVPQYLKKIIPGIVSLTSGQVTVVSPLALTTGDSNNDNSLNILDYNLILDCFSDLSAPRNCADATKKQANDLTDDGSVNQFDYNLFLRELSVQAGQ